MRRLASPFRGYALLSFLAAALLHTAACGAEDTLASRVIILVNRDDPDSLRIGRHYAEVRGVPAANLIALKMPLAEVITWREFIATLWQPLLEQLVAAQWIDATRMALTDSIGRRKYAPRDHRIAALIVCRGVPLKIAHDPEFLAEVLPFTKRAEFRTNAGAVDAELALLAQPNYPITAFVPNPLFQNARPTPFDLGRIVKVARLDGPTADEANALVDRAVAAERMGLVGRAYVDLANRDKVGDTWLESTASQLAALGFDLSVDRDAATMPITARIDAPVLYFGWYAGEINGPFTLPGFRFPPGAIALHIYSFSAATLRLPTGGWTGPFVARGVTATVGNVYEPYLAFTHRPDLLVRALARGDTLADAACYSLQALSWQAVLIGDPLYRPFAVSVEEQMKNLSRIPPRLAGYAVLRKVRQLDAAGDRVEATALAVSAQRDAPNLALGVALAQRWRDAGDNAAAGAALEIATLAGSFEPTEWALAREAAQLLESCGRAASACDVWRTLLASKTIPRELRVAWLPEASKVAVAARDSVQAAAWQSELAESTAAGDKK
jgi:uncharacterized protein (TIGR03790 family)